MSTPPLDLKQSPEIIRQQKEDIALFFKEDGDENFSPTRNQAVMESVKRKMLANRQRILKEEGERIEERVSALMTYMRSLRSDQGTPIERYFGKKGMAHLRGERILKTIKTKLNGKMQDVAILG